MINYCEMLQQILVLLSSALYCKLQHDNEAKQSLLVVLFPLNITSQINQTCFVCNKNTNLWKKRGSENLKSFDSTLKDVILDLDKEGLTCFVPRTTEE